MTVVSLLVRKLIVRRLIMQFNLGKMQKSRLEMQTIGNPGRME